MQWAPLALLWAAWGCEGRIRNDGADELFVEYEDYELPDNETGAQHSLIPCARTPPHPTSCSVHRGHGRRGTAHPLRWPAAAPAPRRRSLRGGRQRPALGPYPARPRANGAAARAAGSAHDREWEAHDALEWYGFDIAPCLASGCTEEMLNNERCDDQCNHALCDYGPPPAIANRRSLPGGSRPPSLLAAGRSILTAAGVGCGQTWGCASSSTICMGTAGILRVRRRPSPRLLYPLSQASPSDSACLRKA